LPPFKRFSADVKSIINPITQNFGTKTDRQGNRTNKGHGNLLIFYHKHVNPVSIVCIINVKLE